MEKTTESHKVIQVLENPYFRAELDDRNYMGFIHKTGGVAILPVTSDQKILLLEQDRPRAGGIQLEIPRGFMGKDETFEQAARRELKEETNCDAGKITYLGEIHTDDGCVEDCPTIVMASDVNAKNIVPQGDEGIFFTQLLTFPELMQIVCKNKIHDSFTLTAIAFVLCKGIFHTY